MKNFILYYYNLVIDDVVSQENYFYLSNKDSIYYFCKVRKREEELERIYEVTLHTKYHLLIKNKYNRFISEYNGEYYCLLWVRCLLNDTITYDEIMMDRSLIMIENFLDWRIVWQEKIDYLEEQMKEFRVGKESFYKSFIYFIGLAENAVSYLSYNHFTSNNVSLCHYRVYWPNKPVNYYNSLNTLIDYDMRDYAEYIKAIFFKGDYDCIGLVRKLIENKRYTMDDFGLFYARMLYPSYFFDCFSNNILKDKVLEDDLVKILDKIDKYEYFLKDIYYEIKKKYSIPEVSWIIKKSNKTKY